MSIMRVNALKIFWVFCSLAVVAVTLHRDTPGAPNDIGIFLAYGMLALTFPSGFAVVALIAFVAFLQEKWELPLSVLDRQYVGFSLIWLMFFIAGYVQWFVLLPWLWRKWKARRAGSGTSSV